MKEELVNFNHNIAQVILFVSILISIFLIGQFNRLTTPIKVFGIYYIVATCIEMLSLRLSTLSMPNLYLFHIFTLLEFWFLVIFFKECARFYSRRFNYLRILVPGVIFIVLNSLIWQGIDVFNSYSSPVVSLAILILSFRFFYVNMDQAEDEVLRDLKGIVISLLIYHSSTLIVLLFSNDLLNIDGSKQLVIWLCRSVLLLLTKLYLAFIIIRIMFRPQNRNLLL